MKKTKKIEPFVKFFIGMGTIFALIFAELYVESLESTQFGAAYLSYPLVPNIIWGLIISCFVYMVYQFVQTVSE